MTQFSLGIVREEELDIAWNKKHTAIVFTIAPNGHVISHEIDDVAEGKGGGQKNDIELEIFAPGDSGYLLWRRGEKYSQEKRDKLFILGYQRLDEFSLTRCQKRKITAIVSQGEKIQRMLGTLMVNSNPSSFEAYTHRSTLRSTHLLLRGDPVANRKDLRLIECSYKYPQNKWNSSALNIWNIEYDNVNCSFLFSHEYHPDHVAKSQTDIKYGREYIIEGVFFRIRNDQKEDVIVPSAENPYIHTNIAHIPQFSYRRHLADQYPVVFYAVQAENKKFNFAPADMVVKRNLVAPQLRVMFGVENIFDFYEIDDAVLLLEEAWISDTVSELYWTLAIAHNMLIRNFKRIVSNNPFLV